MQNIAELYRQVRAWLDPLVADGLVRFKIQKSSIDEEPVGQYKVDILRLYVGSQEVVFYPKGFMIVGAEGRVDIRGHMGIRSIIFGNGQWSAVERAVKLKVILFNEQSFQDILSEVME